LDCGGIIFQSSLVPFSKEADEADWFYFDHRLKISETEPHRGGIFVARDNVPGKKYTNSGAPRYNIHREMGLFGAQEFNHHQGIS